MKKCSLFFLCLLPLTLVAQNITVIGVGRLGLCLALCLEKSGHNVMGVDLSPDYIAQLNNKTFVSPEPCVTEYLKNSQNFKATTSYEEALAFSDLYFIVVPTNAKDGKTPYDPFLMTQALSTINSFEVANKQIVICATVPPGYSKTARALIQNCQNATLCYNPEFIAQGAIIKGLEHPDLVLIGEDSKEAGDRLEALYTDLCDNTPHIARMSIESAEITKMALNCFITAKIAFANAVADVADETPGADKYAILNALGKDQRIGPKCLLPGYGFGGPCFPRDNRAFGLYTASLGMEPTLFSATDKANREHAEYMAQKLLKENLEGYLFEDVNYKPNCPVQIIEESQKLAVAKIVALAGKRVTILDSAPVISQVQKEYGDLFHYVIKD